MPDTTRLNWGAYTPLVRVAYSQNQFTAVFEMPIGYRETYLACRERYGENPVAGLVFDASSPEEALERLGEPGVPVGDG